MLTPLNEMLRQDHLSHWEKLPQMAHEAFNKCCQRLLAQTWSDHGHSNRHVFLGCGFSADAETPKWNWTTYSLRISSTLNYGNNSQNWTRTPSTLSCTFRNSICSCMVARLYWWLITKHLWLYMHGPKTTVPALAQHATKAMGWNIWQHTDTIFNKNGRLTMCVGIPCPDCLVFPLR